nr:EOG090X03TK [Artemia franciscana]
MRTEVVLLGSLFLTSLVVGNAFFQKDQFYPSIVYITKSNPSMMVIYVQALVFVIMLGKIVRKIFFGQLRNAEVEHVVERSWYAVTETCLAFTVFKDDFSFRFVSIFTVLLFLKFFHWLAEDRVDFMERSPVISWLFHIRVSSLLVMLSFLDAYFIYSAYLSTVTKGASVQLVFGFEYAILLTIAASTAVKYLLHTIDSRSETPWENKTVYVLYLDLVIGFFKVILYALFMAIMIKVYTIPLFAIRPMYLTLRSFKKSLNDVIMSRRAIRNMNELYPDATEEELRNADNVCIICREEMTVGAKKLPCNHIFHTVCLRSWFQRQQTCPTCRLDVLRTPVEGTFWEGRGQAQAPAEPEARPAAAPAAPGLPFFMPPNIAAGAATQAPRASGESTAASGSQPVFTPPGPLPFPFMPLLGTIPPPPTAPTPVTGLSVEELLAMESQTREAIEARINCLRNIQTLLDAAVLQFHQYNSVAMALNKTAAQNKNIFEKTGFKFD